MTLVLALFFQQKWRYDWRLWTGVTAPWTYTEKQRFHRRVDLSIWRVWSNRYRVYPRGTHEIVHKFGVGGMLINFDVMWTVSGSFHWSVKAFKVPAGSTPTSPHRSNVVFSKRTMELNTADVTPRGAGNSAGVSTSNFETPAHEFGHTFDNRDEYVAGSPHLSDTNSLINIGHIIRARHVRLIIAAMDTMISGVRFRF